MSKIALVAYGGVLNLAVGLDNYGPNLNATRFFGLNLQTPQFSGRFYGMQRPVRAEGF